MEPPSTVWSGPSSTVSRVLTTAACDIEALTVSLAECSPSETLNRKTNSVSVSSAGTMNAAYGDS